MNQVDSKIGQKCQACQQPLTGCCIEKVCSSTIELICFYCQRNWNNSLHFLHQIIQLRSFCTNVDINMYEKIVLKSYENIIQKFKQVKIRIQQNLKMRKIKKYLYYIEESTATVNQLENKYLQLIQNMKLREVIYQQLKQIILNSNGTFIFQNLSIIKNELLKLKSLNIDYLNEISLVLRMTMLNLNISSYNQELRFEIFSYRCKIENIQFNKHSFYNSKMINQQKLMKLEILNNEPLDVNNHHLMELSVCNVKYKFNQLPKSIIKLILTNEIPSQKQMQEIINTNQIKQLGIQVYRALHKFELKRIFKQVLQIKKLRIFTVQSIDNNFKFGFKNRILLSIKKKQIQKLHLSRLHKHKWIRHEILQMWQP